MQPAAIIAPPDGFAHAPFTGIFNKTLGPWYCKPPSNPTDLAVWGIRISPTLIRDSQVPIAHGGVLMAFADFTMYYGARKCIDQILQPGHVNTSLYPLTDSLATVTISMTCDFMSAVKLGDFLESHLEVGRASKGITFMRNKLMVGDKCVMQCSGTYTLKAPAN